MEVLSDTYRRHQVVLKLSDSEVGEFLSQLDYLIALSSQKRARVVDMMSDLYNAVYNLEES